MLLFFGAYFKKPIYDQCSFAATFGKQEASDLDVFQPENCFDNTSVIQCTCLSQSLLFLVMWWQVKSKRGNTSQVCTVPFQVTATNVKRALRVGKRHVVNAERDCHNKFTKLGFSLPVPIQTATHECGSQVLTMNWVKVSDWLKYLLEKPSVLGMVTVGLREQCKEFWRLYRAVHPSHTVFSSQKDLSFCLPLVLYGDEGRGPKRASFLDFCFETPFGLLGSFEPTAKGCSCDSFEWPQSLICPGFGPFERDSDVAARCPHNQKAHSYLTRHLIFGLASYLYKQHPHIVETHLRLVSEDMRELYDTGVQVGQGDEKETWWGVLIGIKGDLKFQAEVVGCFNRSHATLKDPGWGMCPYCLAGSLRCSFEEIDQDPSWTETLFESRPWDAAPVLTTVPFDQERPEFVFKLDLFHVMKVGLSRHVVGSLIIILSKLGYFDLDPHGAESHDINDRLSRAHGLFKLWCAGVGKSPGLRSFTRTFMNCKTFSCAPWANSKGSDTTLLVAWLTFFISLTLQGLTQDHGDRFFLSVAKTVLENIKGMHQVCESHGLWLDRSCGQNLYARMILVAKGYNVLAKQGIDLGIVTGFGC